MDPLWLAGLAVVTLLLIVFGGGEILMLLRERRYLKESNGDRIRELRETHKQRLAKLKKKQTNHSD